MTSKSILTGLLISIFLVGFALAEGGFYGTINYKDCTCDTWDDVMIQLYEGGGEPDAYGVFCAGVPCYNTGHHTYPTGYYKLWVDLNDFSDCDKSNIEIIYHDADLGDQEVNLTVNGKEDQPEGGGDE